MPNFRVISPAKAASPITTPGGRSYPQTPGAAYDIGQSDAEFLSANGWQTVGQVGATSQRPSSNLSTAGIYGAQPGTFYVDTSLNAVIVFDGSGWRSALTGAAV